jgi:hypothetical protein
MRQETQNAQSTSLEPANGLLGHVDTLSPLAHNLLKLNRERAYDQLVVRGDGDDEARAQLDLVQPNQLVSVPVTQPADAKAMLAGLWLWHDWLDRSHVISQSLHHATGSFWHAIMHRREGDFGNSKYWYDRVDSRHPALPAIGQHVGTMINPLPADKSLLRLLAGGWSPHAFVDLVEEVSSRPSDPRQQVLVEIQRIEWRVLFDHCARQAGAM